MDQNCLSPMFVMPTCQTGKSDMNFQNVVQDVQSCQIFDGLYLLVLVNLMYLSLLSYKWLIVYECIKFEVYGSIMLGMEEDYTNTIKLSFLQQVALCHFHDPYKVAFPVTYCISEQLFSLIGSFCMLCLFLWSSYNAHYTAKYYSPKAQKYFGIPKNLVWDRS